MVEDTGGGECGQIWDGGGAGRGSAKTLRLRPVVSAH